MSPFSQEICWMGTYLLWTSKNRYNCLCRWSTISNGFHMIWYGRNFVNCIWPLILLPTSTVQVIQQCFCLNQYGHHIVKLGRNTNAFYFHLSVPVAEFVRSERWNETIRPPVYSTVSRLLHYPMRLSNSLPPIHYTAIFLLPSSLSTPLSTSNNITSYCGYHKCARSDAENINHTTNVTMIDNIFSKTINCLFQRADSTHPV